MQTFNTPKHRTAPQCDRVTAQRYHAPVQCQRCGYELWNLSEPRCPECGLEYDLRQYRFAPGSVAFGCPHCGALHAGDGLGYLPARSDQAACRSCGQMMNTRQLLVVPLTDRAKAEANVMAWDNRKNLGWLRAWWRTTGLSMAQPNNLIARLHHNSTFASALSYAYVNYLIAGLAGALGIIGFFLIITAIGAAVGGGVDDDMIVFAAIWSGISILSALAMPILAMATIALPAHLFLMLVEPNRRSLGATCQAVMFGQGPAVLYAIPLIGCYCSQLWYIWIIISCCVTVTCIHKTSGWKGAFAVLWVPIMIIIAYVGLFFLMITADM